MNRLSSKIRKLIYGIAILVLVIPIIWLGRPSSGREQEDQGGQLAQLRRRYDLGENQIGKVDPTSSAMNLVLLGFRGIAADLIWVDANDNQETKNWAEMRANVDAIIVLQPHFVRVWQFQGWNLAYNVSAAWDLVADRFYWVKEGAKFLKRGCETNRKVAQLPYEEGRVVGTKVGRADEWKFYREFFKVDPNQALFKGRSDPELNPEGKDNYLAAKDLYLVANELQERYPQSVSMLEALFCSYPYRSQLNYADALQREGLFDEISRGAWEKGYREWTLEYGQKSFYSPGGKYHLEMDPQTIADEARNQNVDPVEFRNWVIRMQNETRYPYWKLRALVEGQPSVDKNNKPVPSMVEAHRLIYDGQQQFKKGNLSGSRDLLFRGMTLMKQVLAAHPDLAGDDEVLEEALSAVLYWKKILKLQLQPEPDYPLKELWDTKREGYMLTIEGRFKRDTGQD